MADNLTPITREEIFLDAIADAVGGGGGGTSDYDDLENKPSINGVTLSGNKTTAQLGTVTYINVANYSINILTDIASGIENFITAGLTYMLTNSVMSWSGTYKHVNSVDESDYNNLVTELKNAIKSSPTYIIVDSIYALVNAMVDNSGGGVSLVSSMHDVASGVEYEALYGVTLFKNGLLTISGVMNRFS